MIHVASSKTLCPKLVYDSFGSSGIFKRQNDMVGKVQETAGDAMGNKQTQAKGIQMQAEGSMLKTVGNAKEMVKDARDAVKDAKR